VYAYFFSFTLITNFLMINVFVAVVLKNFEEEVMSDPKNSTNPISRDVIITYGEEWSALNAVSTMACTNGQLELFLENLDEPLGKQGRERDGYGVRGGLSWC
jgi:hypothetical protein